MHDELPMQHYIYLMNGSDPAPAGGGDTKSWFEYYKVGTGPDVFVPFTAEQLPEEERPNVGDLLWFIMDGFPTGVTKITGALVDPMHWGSVEVFYDSDRVTPVISGGCVKAVDRSGKVTDPTSLAWYNEYLQSAVVDR